MSSRKLPDLGTSFRPSHHQPDRDRPRRARHRQPVVVSVPHGLAAQDQGQDPDSRHPKRARQRARNGEPWEDLEPGELNSRPGEPRRRERRSQDEAENQERKSRIGASNDLV